jgi:hypothetical protein
MRNGLLAFNFSSDRMLHWKADNHRSLSREPEGKKTDTHSTERNTGDQLKKRPWLLHGITLVHPQIRSRVVSDAFLFFYFSQSFKNGAHRTFSSQPS